MRLFVAIDIPDHVKECLHSFVSPLRPLAKLSWSPVDHLHITLKFIGEWPEERLGEMKDALKAMEKPGPIGIQVHDLGWFPNDRRPRVLWAGVTADEGLHKLARTADQTTAELGVPREERDFSPHLTLARIREAVPLGALRRALELAPAQFGSFRASKFFLYLSRAGKYTKLAEFAL